MLGLSARSDKTLDMLNGAGMLHGGCLAYMVDKCALSLNCL